MTELRSRRHRAAPSASTVTTSLLRAIPSRPRVAPSLQRHYRVGLSAGLALVLVGGVSAAAVVEDDSTAASRSDLAALGLEIDPAAPDTAIEVPELEEWTLEPFDVDVELDKSDVYHLRDAQVAARNAEREAIAEREAAEQQAAEQQAAEQQAAEQQAAEQQAAEQQAAEEQAAEEQAAGEQQATEEPAPEADEPSESSSTNENRTTQAPAEEAPAPASATQGGERGALAGMVNNYRGQNGLSGLSRDGTLDQVAQNWAQWMASNQILQHNPNSRSQIGSGWSRSGENIVRNTGAQSWSSGKITSWMFNWWQNSAPHRANILNTAYTHVGVGYVMGTGGPYAVLLFGGR